VSGRHPDWKIRANLARYTVEAENGCLLFTGYRDKQGYARLYDGVEKRLVHRLVYEVHIGPIPEGKQVDHVYARGCRYRHCINHAHLEAVTPLENTRRGVHGNAAKTHCDHGHEFSEKNTRLHTRPDGSTVRMCWRCDADRAQDARDRNRIVFSVTAYANPGGEPIVIVDDRRAA